jgi:hypothetical protein
VTHAPRRRPQPEKQACTPINLSINPLTNAGTLTYDQHGGTSPPLTHQDRAGADRPGPYAVIDRSGLCLGSQILIPPRLHARFSYPPPCCSLRHEHSSRGRKCWREPFPLSLAGSTPGTDHRRPRRGIRNRDGHRCCLLQRQCIHASPPATL